VHDGNTCTDHDDIERKRGITIMAAAVSCNWRGHRLNLVDTPGHVDFTIEVERSLRVLDGAVVVLDGVAGVEPQTETVWRQAQRHRVPRIVFVNKLDRAGADFARCLLDIEKRLRTRALPLALPVFSDGEMAGVIDLVRCRELLWHGAGPSSYEERRLSLSDNPERQRLLEACAEEDASLVEPVLAGAEIAPERLDAAIRRATLAGRLTPVLPGAAYRHRGIEPLLDAVVAYLPSPLDRFPDLSEDLTALAFKVVFDDHGQMSFVRVYSGVLEKGMTVLAARAGKKLRVGRLARLFADQREEVARLSAGEIGAVLALPLQNGETLCSPDAPVVLEEIYAPEPLVRIAVEAKTSRDRDRLGIALGRMTAADPSLRIESDPETGQTLLGGMGQLHLEIAVERLFTEHEVEVKTGAPRVAYRSTLRRKVRREHRHVKQSGGPGQWAQVTLEVGPAERGAGLVFEDRTRGGVIPREYVNGVEKGVREALAIGLLGGHLVVDVKVAVVDGATHSNDSSELAFKIAGAAAFRAAAAEADAGLLEPVMRLEVICPEAELGAVVGDIGRRRGQVQELDARGDERVVRAEVPLAEMFGYAGALSGLTHGRGRFTLDPSRYEMVPDALTHALVDK
jgi:elongation factor G